jgi:hypothetical protein
MNIELLVLCDAATDYQGKLNILGTFDSIWAKQMPVVHPLCAVAMRLRVLKTEEGEHKIKITLVDEDGRTMVKPVEASVNIVFNNRSLPSIATNMILNLQGLKFPDYGEYSIDLTVDGRHEATLPLFVNRIPEQRNN